MFLDNINDKCSNLFRFELYVINVNCCLGSPWLPLSSGVPGESLHVVDVDVPVQTPLLCSTHPPYHGEERVEGDGLGVVQAHVLQPDQHLLAGPHLQAQQLHRGGKDVLVGRISKEFSFMSKLFIMWQVTENVHDEFLKLLNLF